MAGDERQVERRENSWRPGNDRGDGVDDARGRGDQARVVVIALAAAVAEVECVVGLSGDLDPVRAALLGRLRPIRAEVVAQSGDVLEHDDGLAADDALHLEAHGRRRALRNVSRRDVEVLGRGHPDVLLDDLVQREAEAGGELTDHRTPGHAEYAVRAALLARGRGPQREQERMAWRAGLGWGWGTWCRRLARVGWGGGVG